MAEERVEIKEDWPIFLTYLTMTVNSSVYMPLKFQIYFLGSFSTAVKSFITSQLQYNLELSMTAAFLEEKPLSIRI